MTSVMISHSGMDSAAASQVAVHLASEHIAVWFDAWEIDIGDPIPGRIEEGLSKSTHVVLLWSESASTSPWVTAERRSALAAALASGQPRILVVRLDDEPLPPLLNDRKYLRWHGGTPEDHRAIAEAVLGRRTRGEVIRNVVATYNSVVFDPGPTDHLSSMSRVRNADPSIYRRVQRPTKLTTACTT